MNTNTEALPDTDYVLALPARYHECEYVTSEKGYTEEMMHAHAAKLCAARDAEIERLRADAARWNCVIDSPTVPATKNTPEHELMIVRWDHINECFLQGGCGVSDPVAQVDECIAALKESKS